MGSPCQRGDARGERLRRGWAAERAGPSGRPSEVGVEVAGPAGRGWAALGWAREKGKGEVMGRTGLGFCLFYFYFYSIAHSSSTI